MRVFQLGLIVVIALIALFVPVQWAMAQSPASSPAAPTEQAAPQETTTVHASAIDVVGLVITATVGTNPSVCPTTNTVQVRAGTIVYYCFTLRHTGVSGDESLTFHHIDTSRGLHRDISLSNAPSITLNPGDIKNTVSLGFGASFTDSASVDVTNFFTWTARPADGEPQVIAFAHASTDVVAPSVTVVKTVGQDPNQCASSNALTIPSGSKADFCITIHNTGDITLTSHTLNDAKANINNATFTHDIAPGASLNIMQSNLAALGISGALEQTNIQGAIANSATYNGRTANGLAVEGSSEASVNIGNTTVLMTKRLSTIAEDCTGPSSIQVPAGTELYYCVTIQNTGSVTLTHHQLDERYLSIKVDFDYTLPPQSTLNVTNNFLASVGQPVVLGPFDIDPKFDGNNVVGNTMLYTGTAPGGFSVSTSASASVAFPPPPTATATRRPHSTATSTPFFPPTSTDTPTPATATPTETPTETPVTPSPTPTRSYAISSIATPTPRVQSAVVPGAPPSPDQSLPPTADPNSQAQLPPGQDPIIATATQLAVDATSTSVSAEATAAEVQIENAQATALAETQATVAVAPTLAAPLPESPLPTPIPVAVDGNSAGLPVAPGIESPLETPTASALLTTTLPGSSLPGASLADNGSQPLAPGIQTTVLPGVVTIEVATATPAILVLIVTNTPEPGTPVFTPESQRPIVYPTPTATADFVMAAARTFDVAVETFGWLWFLVGSLIFFVTTGIVAGLFFRQSEASRYELPEPDYWLEEDPTAARQAEQRAEEEWPEDLP